MIVKKYQITKMNSVRSVNRIVNEIKKIESVFNATIDKSTRILRVECSVSANEKDSYKQLDSQILKAVQMYEKHAKLTAIDNAQIYRKVLYLKGLDCAYCGARIENIAKKELNHERIMVDYPTYRFIIDTTDKDLVDHITERVTEVAHKVDERIIVSDYTKANREEIKEEKSFTKLELILMSIGLALFIIGACFYYPSLNYFTNIEKTFYFIGVVLIVIGYLLIGHRIIIRFFKNLFKGRVFDENFLMTVASICALATQNFPEAAIVMALYQLGEFLQQKAVNKTRKSITELLSYEVKTVKLRMGDDVSEIAVEGVLPDDVIVVTKGEMIPLDGKIVKGKTYIDTKNITGESLARSVDVGDEVLSGSLNIGSLIEIRVTKTYNNSMMTRILDLVENATASKAKTENFITKFSKYYTPVVAIIAALIAGGGSLFYFLHWTSISWTKFVYIAMEYLVISCPCALVISIPLCFFCSIGVASKRGILIKGSNCLEALYHSENMVFDKTGTLTKGDFAVAGLIPAEGVTTQQLERTFIYAEYFSTHPIAEGVVRQYGKENIFTEIIDEFQQCQGGVKAVINGSNVIVGNAQLCEREKLTYPEIETNYLVVYVYKEKQYLGAVEIGDKIRDEAFDTITNLRQNGIEKTYMLTGDSRFIANDVANKLNIDEVFSELLPDEKVEILDNIKENVKSKHGKTVYVGDGINDAPVIACSDVGIAMGDTASDATIQIADVVIMTSNLNKLTELNKIARLTRRRVIENLVFCLGVKLVVMILALDLAGFEYQLPLVVAIFSDVGVSLIAILNSLRLMRMFGKQQRIEKTTANVMKEEDINE